MKIQTYYIDIIKSKSKENIKEYIDKFVDKKITIFFEIKTYKKYKNILELDYLSISSFINIKDIDIEKNFDFCKNSNILILVESFYFHTKIYKYLHDQKIYENDICNDLLLDMDILIDDKFHLFWNNIIKLESYLKQNYTDDIIQKKYTSYVELFKNMLIKSNFIKDNEASAIIYTHVYQDIFANLPKKMKNLIVLTDNNSDQKNFFYGIDYLRFFDFIYLFIGTSSSRLPKNSKYINIKHGIMDQPSPISYDLNSVDSIAHIFYMKNTQSKIDINIVSSKFINTTNTILLGSPQLDNLLESYSKSKIDLKKIMIVASSVLWNDKNLNHILKDKDFIPSIARKFDKYKIIFRAHHGEIQNKYIKEYINNLKNYSNIIFDNDISFTYSYINTNVLISDGLSTSTYTYALATSKPIIFYIPNYEKYFNSFKHTYHAKYLNIIGDIVTNKSDLIKMIYKYLADDDYLQAKSLEIKNFRDKNIVNIGSSQEQIILFLQKYIEIEQNNKITNFYRAKLTKNAKEQINKFFDKFKNKKIAIYGAGEHFENVLNKIYDFSKLDIVCFSDSNHKIIGAKKLNKPILDKNYLQDVDVILISSKKYEKEIKEDLSKQYADVYGVYEELKEAVHLCLNSTWDQELKNLWLNIQLIENRLDANDIDKIINSQYQNYNDLLNGCKSLYTNSHNEKVDFSNNFSDIYLKDKILVLFDL